MSGKSDLLYIQHTQQLPGMPHIAANIRAGREPLNILVGKLPHPDPVRARRACGINNESVCSAGLAERSAKLDQRSIVCENIIFFRLFPTKQLNILRSYIEIINSAEGRRPLPPSTN